MLAGELAHRQRRQEEALAYYQRVPRDAGQAWLAAKTAAGELYVQRGQIADAERCLREVLRDDPDDLAAHRRLAELLILQGRRWESAPRLFELIRGRNYTVRELALLANLEFLQGVSPELKRALEAVPDDPRPLLGLARLALYEQELEDAERLARRILAHYPDHREAAITLGKCLVESAPEQEFLAWRSDLPVGAEAHPDYWAILGRWAQRWGEGDAAIRCYWEAVRRNPNHQRANYQLSQLLIAEGRGDAAQPFLRRARLLDRYAVAAHPSHFGGRGPRELEMLLEAGKLAEMLGRPWEAWAWYNAARLLYHDGPARAECDRIARGLTPTTPQVLASANPAFPIDLSSYPVPDQIENLSPRRGSAAKVTGRVDVEFADQAEMAGIEFSYFSGGRLETGIPIHRSLGGGVGVIDFDLDGWPDIHLAQGGEWPERPGQQNHLDRLFRNAGGRCFEGVTAAAGVGEEGFSHGVAVGDFNADGFPDLSIANVGSNRLYRNNGDGTFADVTVGARMTGSRWTTSVVLADLNGDALPDVYEVGYIAGQRVYSDLCFDPEHQVSHSCEPKRYAAEDDCLWVNLGDGTFRNASSETGILVPDGRGLGILAANVQDSGKLDLFVANDMTANFFFVNRTEGGGVPRFDEEGYSRGLALDFDGRAQACMGIAAADADGNGLLDLFVTNFYRESDTLYLQQEQGIFVDSSVQCGLREPSLWTLGFGTQFIDAELDGWPDLVVGNGHVDDYRHEEIPFRMRPQYYSNRGGGRFMEVMGPSLGDYFERECLGRGLARIDWNRDGREDFVVSHLDRPVALVTNLTPNAGNFLAIELRGTTSPRDAIGTVVRVMADDRTWTGQLTAGDGYLASNHRRLVFGLGDRAAPVTVRVRWPSGREQTFTDIPVNAEILLVEGRPRAFGQPRP